MRDEDSVWADNRWQITEKGRRDLMQLPECVCTPVFSGIVCQCEECGTVYGVVSLSSAPRRAMWTVR